MNIVSNTGPLIALASELNLPLVIDDRLGRLAAQRLNIPITGVVGVLIRAKLENLIPSLREILGQMRDKGYWLSDGLIAQALQLSGE
jgi:predicted nucleic acid-binding protein